MVCRMLRVRSSTVRGMRSSVSARRIGRIRCRSRSSDGVRRLRMHPRDVRRRASLRSV